MSYTQGQKITLKSAAAYVSSTASKSYGTKTGTFYIWSAATKNGRIRITIKKSYCGKNPASKYVTCWVKTSSIGSSSSKSSSTTTSTSKSTSTTVKTTSATSPTSTKNTTTIVNIVEASNVTPTTTSPGQIGYLGKVLFIVSCDTIKTLDSFTMTASARYVEHDRHLKTPRVEFTGVDAVNITFSLTLNQYLGASVWDDYTTLESYMNGGIAVPLKIGSKAYGTYRWCIQSLSLKGKTTDAKGNWTTAEVAVALISTEKKG